MRKASVARFTAATLSIPTHRDIRKAWNFSTRRIQARPAIAAIPAVPVYGGTTLPRAISDSLA